jgi:hypothetical protein
MLAGLLLSLWSSQFPLLASVRLCCTGGPRHEFRIRPRAPIGACADFKRTRRKSVLADPAAGQGVARKSIQTNAMTGKFLASCLMLASTVAAQNQTAKRSGLEAHLVTLGVSQGDVRMVLKE